MTRLIAALFAMLIATAAAAQSEYRAQSGDTLTIEVLEDPTLNRSVVVLPDGRFSFPFAGTVQARGRTIGQIQSDITNAISSSFAAPPTVFVSLVPAPRDPASALAATGDTIDVYFLGEVAQPGLREVEPGTTFLQAMAQAGTLTRFAATKRIQLRRRDPSTGQQTIIPFNLKAISQGARLNTDPRLRDGDVIVVPTRRLFE